MTSTPETIDLFEQIQQEKSGGGQSPSMDFFEEIQQEKEQPPPTQQQKFATNLVKALVHIPMGLISGESDEDYQTSVLRTLAQIPLGLASKFSIPADIIQQIATGESLNPEEIDQIKRISDMLGIPFDEEKYRKTVTEAAEFFPTQGNIERGLEQAYGLPLQPKTKLQKGLRFASTATAFSPKQGASLRGFQKPLPRPIVGAGVEGVKEVLEASGLPEPAAELLSFFAMKKIPGKKAIKTPKDLESAALKSIQDIGPDGLPFTFYETAEQILSELQAEEKVAFSKELDKIRLNDPAKGIRPSPLGTVEKKPITAKKSDADLGLRPTGSPKPENIEESVLNKISKNEIYNKRRTGQELKNIVNELDRTAYSQVRNLYNEAKEINSTVSDIRPQLVDSLEEKLREINAIPSPSSVQDQLRSRIRNILKELVEYDSNGNVTGYLEMDNRRLIDQIQSLRQSIDFDFAHGKPKNIFKPTIDDLLLSVEDAAQRLGNKEALNSFNEANRAYREWSQNFDNDYIRPYRNRANRDFERLFDKILDSDEFNVMRDLIGNTSEGNKIINSTKRDIVENKLKDVLKDPRKINQRKLDRKFRELESILTSDEIQELKNEIRDIRKEYPIRANQLKKEEANLKAIEKYINKTPSDIRKMMDSREGIRELRDKLSKNERQKNLFYSAAQHKLLEILKGGRITKKMTGKELYDILDLQSNYDLVEELTSKEIAKDLLDAAKKLGKKQVTQAALKDLGKKFAGFAGIKYLLGLF